MRLLIAIIVLMFCSPAFSADKVKVQVIFDAQTEVGNYTDALYFTPSEYASKTPAQIEALKKERVDNFVARVKEDSAKEAPEPTEEDLIKQAEQIDEAIASLQVQKSEVIYEIDSISKTEEAIVVKDVAISEVLK